VNFLLGDIIAEDRPWIYEENIKIYLGEMTRDDVNRIQLTRLQLVVDFIIEHYELRRKVDKF
jgi:hypothetical protein